MDASTFGSWLKERRKALDLTQHDLAHQIGCSVATIRKIEANKLRPSKHIAERLATYLDIQVADLAIFTKFARTGESPATWMLRAAAADTDRSPSLYDYPTSLPTWPTPLLGREQDLERIRQRIMHPDIRLLTLTGAPGIGKTRVAVQAATELIGMFDDGVFFIALALLREPHQLPAAIAQALGMPVQTSQVLQSTLKTYLSDKQLLMLMDNFEHIVDMAPFVGELLAVAPSIKVLVTSRAKLHLYGEHELLIRPLALPDPAHLPGVDQLLAECASVALFTSRVQAVRSDFVLTSANSAIVAQICVQLDGLPLAIELAAARSKLFAPPALLARLTRRLDMLIGGPRDMPARQQTFRRTIDWSYELLDQEAQILFRQLGVFAGGCTVSAVAAVFARHEGLSREVGGPELPTIDSQRSLVACLAALVDQSLVWHAEQGDSELRFALPEVFREYALEQLERQGELEAARQRHAHYFLDLAETIAPRLFGADQEVWFERLERDYENVHTALSWCLGYEESELGLRVAKVLMEFWLVGGHYKDDEA